MTKTLQSLHQRPTHTNFRHRASWILGEFFMLALVIFRQEQRELILNPLKMSREVHDDAIKGQGQGVGVGVGLWIVSLIVLLFI